MVQKVTAPKFSLALALLITVLATLWLGIFPSQVLSLAQAGAATFVASPAPNTSAAQR
jgi:hypothetical protein